MKTSRFSIKKSFIKLIFSALLIVGSSSAYAACIVDGTSYNVGGTGLTSSSGAGGAITLAIIQDWDTSGDDITTCDVSNITDMTSMFEDEDANRDSSEGPVITFGDDLDVPAFIRNRQE